jgi:hypothetical protein
MVKHLGKIMTAMSPCVVCRVSCPVPCVLQERVPAPVLGLFGGGTRKVESIATQVERQVESQRTRKGTQVGTRRGTAQRGITPMRHSAG